MSSKQKDAKETRLKTVFNPKIPECGKLSYLVQDLKNIGYFGANDGAIRDQEIFYYAQNKSIKYQPFEIDLLKECAQYYVSAFYEFNDTITPPPYAPVETKEEIEERNNRMIEQTKARQRK